EAIMHGVVGTIEQGGVARRRSLRQIAKRLGLIAAVLGILTAAGWYGWSWWTLGRFMQTTDDAYVGGEVTTIASKVAGFIDTSAVTDKQEVKAGDLLVKLNDPLTLKSHANSRHRCATDQIFAARDWKS